MRSMNDSTKLEGWIPATYVKKGEIMRTLYQAVRGYTAQIDGELTFSKELSDCDRPRWYLGMLADGTTGLYPANYFKPSPVSAQSEA
ncbi:ABI gene family member 3-like [Ruditapes philippinarum]|uniref:ABI gene family member 3-like n=1 Tax=Ruditapes philippinarum TaxID=129788 RepID=UPI00295BA033|nr:ABI gene family member 3-like [Ruditapes philippinarum]